MIPAAEPLVLTNVEASTLTNLATGCTKTGHPIEAAALLAIVAAYAPRVPTLWSDE